MPSKLVCLVGSGGKEEIGSKPKVCPQELMKRIIHMKQ